MAKKSKTKNSKLITSIIAGVLSLFVIIAFFCLPVTTYSYKNLRGDTITESITCLDMSYVGFNDSEEVSKNILKEAANGKDMTSKTYALNIRENEDTSFAFGLTLVVSWIAFITAIATLIFAILSLFFKTGKIAMIISVVLAISVIITFIGAWIIAGNLSKYAIGFASVANLIAGLATCGVLAFTEKK